MIAAEAQAKSKVFNTFVCISKYDITKIVLYENKTTKMTYKANDEKKTNVSKGRWAKKSGNEIWVESRQEREIGKPQWYTDGLLILGKRGNIVFSNPEMYGYDSPKCLMK